MDEKQSHKENPITIGVFPGLAEAEKAVEKLLAEGFDKEAVVVVSSEGAVQKYLGATKGVQQEDPAGSNLPGAMATGGVIGGVLGGLTVALSAATMGSAALLATAGIAAWSGATAGGLISALSSRGVETELADYYDQAVANGKILVAVDCRLGGDEDFEARTASAEAILADSGAEPLHLSEG